MAVASSRRASSQEHERTPRPANAARSVDQMPGPRIMPAPGLLAPSVGVGHDDRQDLQDQPGMTAPTALLRRTMAPSRGAAGSQTTDRVVPAVLRRRVSMRTGQVNDANALWDQYCKAKLQVLERATGAQEPFMKRVLAELVRDNQDRYFDNGNELRQALTLEVSQRKQRADTEAQSMMGEAYWEDKLRDTPNGQQKVNQAKTGQVQFPPRGPGRTMKQVIEEVAPQTLNALANKAAQSPGQLKVYRTMNNDEADQIMAWFKGSRKTAEAALRKGVTSDEFAFRTDDDGVIPVGGHLGDSAQARRYFTRRDEQSMLEFTLKPGAHEVLFTPEIMAVAAGKGANAYLHSLAEGKGTPLQSAGANEGNLSGYVGIKSEQHGPFSLAIGGLKATRLLFQLLVATVRRMDTDEVLAIQAQQGDD